jgi:hypothetical protein
MCYQDSPTGFAGCEAVCLSTPYWRDASGWDGQVLFVVLSTRLPFRRLWMHAHGADCVRKGASEGWVAFSLQHLWWPVCQAPRCQSVRVCVVTSSLK